MANNLKRYSDSEAKQLLKFLPVNYPDWSTYDPNDPQFKKYVLWSDGDTKYMSHAQPIVALFRKSQKCFRHYISYGSDESISKFLRIYNFIYNCPLEDMPIYLSDPFLEPYAAWRIHIAK